MKNIRIGFGLLLMLLFIGLVASMTLRRGKSSSEERRRELDGVLEGDPSASPDANSPKSAKEHMQDSVCRSNCATTARTCSAVADGDEAHAACDAEQSKCLAACP